MTTTLPTTSTTPARGGRRVTMRPPQRPGVSYRTGTFRPGGRPDITQTAPGVSHKRVETRQRPYPKNLNPLRTISHRALNEGHPTNSTTDERNERMTDYLITECPNHGTTATSDLASARLYTRAARGCRDAGAHSHEPGVSCWHCCESQVIRRYTEHGEFTYGDEDSARVTTYDVYDRQTGVAFGQVWPVEFGSGSTRYWVDGETRQRHPSRTASAEHLRGLASVSATTTTSTTPSTTEHSRTDGH